MTVQTLTMPLRSDFADSLPELCVPWTPRAVARPRLLYFNRALATELNLPRANWDEADLAQVFVGNVAPPGMRPVAQVYAEH